MTMNSSSLPESLSSMIDFNFGDKRINSRANFMANTMVKNMGKLLPQIFSNSTDLKGAYRFLENNLVTPEKILEPHINETVSRCKGQNLVAVLQDSSDLDFDYMKCLEGFNSLHINVDKGFRIHPSLVITEKGTPLGVLASTNYTRTECKLHKKHRNSLPIEEKESYRWLLGYREACKLAEKLPDVQVVSIGDRECDIYECLKEAEIEEGKRKASIIIRSNHNRSLSEAVDETDDKIEKKLIRCPVRFEGKIVLNRYSKDERTACVAIRACEIVIKAPNTCNKKSLSSIRVNAVLVSEIDPPKGVKPLDWLLITTLPIDNVEEIQLIVSLYAKRWHIEIYFKVLKSGCKIDDVRFQSTNKIRNYIAFAMIIAWKTMLATYLPREYPNEPCTCMFTEVEWKLAFRKMQGHATPFPKEPPNLKEMVTLIAMLGGYQKRKDPPGIQTVWRGISRLIDMVCGYEMTQGLALSH